MQDSESPLVVGRISGVYGVRGWLKVMSYTRPKENLFNYSPWLVHRDNNWQAFTIEDSQKRNDRFLVKLVGVDSPEQARDYVNCDLAIQTEQLASLPEGEYYWYQLIGLEVINQQAEKLGTISEILETGANDVLVVSEKKKKRILIPMVKDVYVKQVDLKTGTMQVDWQLEE